MTRLLFAAARGARIEWQNSSSIWKVSVHTLPRIGPNEAYPWRIHPDDLHLQYGPISTILREEADLQQPPRSDILYDSFAGMAPYLVETRWVAPANEMHRSLFLLILAEALADEGL